MTVWYDIYMPENNTLRYRVEQLEKRQEKMDTLVYQVMTNHIPHIEQSLISMDTKIKVLTAVNIGAIILASVLSRML